jgi:dipeptidyl aminopeptidase/acylaminoacyl peptidase
LVFTAKTPAQVVTSVAWGRKNSKLAVACYDNEESVVAVFDTAKLESSDRSTLKEAEVSPQLALKVDADRISALSFRADDTQIAASTDQAIYVFSTRGPGSLDARFPHKESASYLDWSSTSTWLAASYRNAASVSVFDVAAKHRKYRIAAPRDTTCVRFSPNGKRLAIVGYDSLVHLCDSAGGRRVLTLKGSSSHVRKTSLTARVVFSPDGRRIATNDWKGRLTVWQADVNR